MTSLGIVVAAASLLVLVFRPAAWPWVLSAGAPLSAVAVFGGNGIGAFHALAALALGVWVIRRRAPESAARPGLAALALFAAWALLITALGPWLFAGTPVLTPRLGIDATVNSPPPLEYSVSNVAQAGYLVIGFGVVLYLSSRPRLSPWLLGAGLALGMVLTALNLAADWAGIAWPTWFFDANPGVRYISTTATGEPRFRGIFPEPAGLAHEAAVATVFFLAVAWRRRGWPSVLCGLVAGLSAVNLLASESGTAAVVTLVMLLLLGGAMVARGLTGNPRIPVPVLVLAPLVVFVVAWNASTIYDGIAGIIAEKTASDSYYSRTGADAFSLRLLADTWGLGVGLGSNRPSTFLPGLLSTTGIPGTLLFITAVAQITRAAWRRAEFRPVVLALLTLLLAKSVTGSDLSYPLLWLGLGVCAYAAWSSPPSPVTAALESPDAARSSS